MSGFCACDYDSDPVDISRWEERRARKPYRCDECTGPISPGDRHSVNVVLYDGGWSTYRICAPCMDGPVAFVEKNCGCVPWGGLSEHLVEVFRHYEFRHPGVKFCVGRMIVGLGRRAGVRAGARP